MLGLRFLFFVSPLTALASTAGCGMLNAELSLVKRLICSSHGLHMAAKHIELSELAEKKPLSFALMPSS